MLNFVRTYELLTSVVRRYMYIISLTRFHPQSYPFFLVFLIINLYKTLHTSCNFFFCCWICCIWKLCCLWFCWSKCTGLNNHMSWPCYASSTNSKTLQSVDATFISINGLGYIVYMLIQLCVYCITSISRVHYFAFVRTLYIDASVPSF